MKTLGVVLLAFAYVNAISPEIPHLLGSNACTRGPTYWCSNLTAAAGCNAVKHCIQTVWLYKTYPTDGDSVCQICKTMVKQARDQLESNETQEEIKEVFEGSCKLLPIKLINEECCKLADDFIPELIDTLASQMNPDTVCSVAGLCNNAKYDKLLEEQASDVVTKYPPAAKPEDTCTGCHTVVDILDKRFRSMSRNDYLESLLQICGRMGSFSDACSEIIINHFSDIYLQMKQNFNSNNVCLLSGECSTNFHVHEIEITPMSDVGVVPVSDDVPCDLCKQLVGHLRDLLIADTTEEEFKRVLEGLCKQTQGFQKQCLSIVEEYYPVIYKFLVSELNSTEVCSLIQICPNGDKLTPIMPLLPVETASVAKTEMQRPLVRVGVSKDDSNVKVIKPNVQFEDQNPELMQLPIERMNSPHTNNVYNKELCTFCEYFLHYAQEAITDPKTEENIKEVIDKACSVLPSSVNETCYEFVTTYSDALVAILAQEIDPSTICPLIQVCPGKDVEDIEIFMQGTPGDKPNCPLCLLAVTKLEEMVKDKRTKDNIKTALNTLCAHLSGNVREECQDFVDTYTDELIEMLADDFKPQEVCVYLKLCNDSKPAPTITDMSFGGLLSTNEIPDFTANGKVIKPTHSMSRKPQCVLCEFVMDKLENILKDKKTEDEIKQEVHNVCNHMPMSIRQECNDFVDQYTDLIFTLIISEVSPAEICGLMNLCDKKPKVIAPESLRSPQCTLCKVVMTQLETMLVGKVTKEDIINALYSVCSILPKSESEGCDDFIKRNGDAIYNMLSLATSPGEICSLLFLCGDNRPEAVQYHINKCAVCEETVMIMKTILENPKVDHTIEHVMEKSCRALLPKHQTTCNNICNEFGHVIYTMLRNSKDSSMVCKEIDICSETARPVLVGADKCTFGPSYWCSSKANAESCGNGAIQHCNKHGYKSE